MKSVILLAFLFVLAPVFADIWTSCGTATDEFVITDVTIIPDPPVKGQNITVAVVGKLSVEVDTGSQVQLTAKFDGISVFNHAEPLCGNDYIKCPVPAGPLNVTVSPGPIPSTIPSGSYVAKAVFTDQNSKELACVNVALKL